MRAYVEAIDEIQQGGSGLGGRRLPPEPCEALMLRRVDTTVEDVTEQARAESPCACTAAKIASATPGAAGAAPLGYDPYSTRPSPRISYAIRRSCSRFPV